MMSTTYLWVTLLVAALLAPPTYKTYHNARFGYHIDYPADFKPQPEPTNGDGRRFVSPDGQTVLTAYASYLVLDGGLVEHRKMARERWQEQHATLVLDQKTSTGYVLSGTVNGRIFYEKTVLKAGTLTTFEWEYPAAHKAKMDPIIKHTMLTLQPSVAGSN